MSVLFCPFRLSIILHILNNSNVFSFNRISVLENLDAQVNLKVLAVFNNEISKIQNIAHMQKLGEY